jgi:hypothetical protein
MSESAPRNPNLPRFPVIVDHPTYDDARGTFNSSDYAKWGGLTVASFPLGYVFGTDRQDLPRNAREWATNACVL